MSFSGDVVNVTNQVGGKVAEVFASLQGEGVTAGLPSLFVRLQGCSVGCVWCDTKYSWDPEKGEERDLQALLGEVKAAGIENVVVTGGEPLESSLFLPLVLALKAGGHRVEVETDASRGLDLCRVADYDVILCDLSLPGMDGLSFHEGLLRERPNLADRVIFTTGHIRHPVYEEHARRHGRTILHKPFTGEELLGVVGRMGTDS